MPLRGKQAKVPLRESRPEGAITCQPRATPWGSSYHNPAGEYALTTLFGWDSAKLRQKVIGTPGKPFSANSPSAERASLGPKSGGRWALCRSDPRMSDTLRPVCRDEYARYSARDVKRGEATEKERSTWEDYLPLVDSFGRQTATVPRAWVRSARLGVPHDCHSLTTSSPWPRRVRFSDRVAGSLARSARRGPRHGASVGINVVGPAV